MLNPGHKIRVCLEWIFSMKLLFEHFFKKVYVYTMPMFNHIVIIILKQNQVITFHITVRTCNCCYKDPHIRHTRQLSTFVSTSWREQVNFQLDYDEVHFILDQQA